MAKRRKRQRLLGARLILIIALVLLIAGFVTRRMLIPTRGLHRAEPQRFGAPTSEKLNDGDRRELDSLIRSKTK
jgi:hypothetical protein